MAASGNRCEWVGFEGEGHGFLDFGRDDGAVYWETVSGGGALGVVGLYLECL